MHHRVIASFVFLIGTIRVNLFFTFTFFGLVMLFAFIAAADFSVASATTEADLEHITKLLRIAGGFGFLGLLSGGILRFLRRVRLWEFHVRCPCWI
jgi:succinate-acetate transporter protein